MNHISVRLIHTAKPSKMCFALVWHTYKTDQWNSGSTVKQALELDLKAEAHVRLV